MSVPSVMLPLHTQQDVLGSNCPTCLQVTPPGVINSHCAVPVSRNLLGELTLPDDSQQDLDKADKMSAMLDNRNGDKQQHSRSPAAKKAMAPRPGWQK